jgi:aminopeptidase N
VVQPVLSVEQAAFDDITYRKGRAVIRMLENYIGPPAFRDGVQAYMKRYGYKNTVTDNLWDELEKASGKKVKEIAGDFTTKPGIPLIVVENVAPGADSVTINARQKRFGVDESANESTEWTVPVYASAAGPARPPVLGYVKGDQTTAISVPGAAPVKLNAGQTVYYRVKYGGAFPELVKAFDGIGAADQLGLLNDAWALGEAGVAPISDYLDLTLKLTSATDRVVCRQVIETLLAVDSLCGPGSQRDALRAHGRKLLKPVLDSIGWDQKAGERSNETVLREYLIASLAQLGEQGVKVEADRRFRAYAGPPVKPEALPAIIRRPVLQAAAFGADSDLYDVMYGLAKSTTDSFGKDQLFVALAWADNASLAQRSLDIALGDDPARTTGPKIIQRVAAGHPDLAWQFAQANLNRIADRLDEQQRFKFVPSLTATSRSPKVLEELQRYIAEKVPEVARKSVERFVADLKFRLQVIERRLPEIEKWLASHR